MKYSYHDIGDIMDAVISTEIKFYKKYHNCRYIRCVADQEDYNLNKRCVENMTKIGADIQLGKEKTTGLWIFKIRTTVGKDGF